MKPQIQAHPNRRKLGEILVGAGVVDELQLGTALGHQRQWGGRLGNILIDLHFIDDATLASTLAQQLGLRLVDLSNEKVDLEVVRLVPQTLAERHNAFPVNYDPKSREALTVAFSDPTNLAGIDEIRFQTGKTLRIVVAPEGQIAQAIRRFYGGEDPTLTDRPAASSALSIPPEPVAEPALFGKVNEFLAAPEEEDLAELEPIPSDSQISLNIRDLGLAPVPLTEEPGARKTPGPDPLAGFFQGGAAARADLPVAQSPGTGLPQAFRSTPFLGSPPPPPGPPGGVPPVLARSASGTIARERSDGVAARGQRRESQDIFAQAVDLSKKTVEGFVPPPDLLRSQSSSSLPVATEAVAAPPAAPRWELREPTGTSMPAFSDTPAAVAAAAPPQALPPVSPAASETRVAQALARLLIEKGLIEESELLAKLDEE
jgi:type IV pilus assembly protein PilB